MFLRKREHNELGRCVNRHQYHTNKLDLEYMNVPVMLVSTQKSKTGISKIVVDILFVTKSYTNPYIRLIGVGNCVPNKNERRVDNSHNCIS